MGCFILASKNRALVSDPVPAFNFDLDPNPDPRIKSDSLSMFQRDRDMIFDLAKSGIIGKILMSRAHGRPLKFFKVFLYIFN